MLSQLKDEKKKEIDLQGVKDNAKKVVSQIRHGSVDNTKPTRAPSYTESTSHRAETKSEKSVNDYALMDPDRNSNGTDGDFGIDTKKPFKSRYVDDNGAWTHEAVDDGYVEFGDYIKDRREGVDNGISFNGKQFNPKFSNVGDEPYEDEVSYVAPNYGELREKDISEYSVIDYEDDETFRQNLTAGGLTGGYYNLYNASKQKNEWVENNIGGQAAYDSEYYMQCAYINASTKMRFWGLNTDNNNVVDAYRHFIWNAMMTRDKDIGYYNARNITNRYEYEGLISRKLVDVKHNPYDYKKDNTKIKGKMDESVIMDIWNNQVARELANNSVFEDMTVDELFDMAIDYGWLITDSTQVYDFLGITDYVIDEKYVNAEWDLTTNNIIFTKNGMWVELKIGV